MVLSGILCISYEFLHLKAPAEIPDNKPPDTWPDQGTVSFDHYSTRYRPGLDLVLKNISYQVSPAEKVRLF